MCPPLLEYHPQQGGHTGPPLRLKCALRRGHTRNLPLLGSSLSCEHDAHKALLSIRSPTWKWKSDERAIETGSLHSLPFGVVVIELPVALA